MSYRIEPIWTGRTVVILGGGQSLTAEVVRQVAIARQRNRCRVIAVNDAIYLAWWADWLHAADCKWLYWHSDAVCKFPGIKTTICENVPNDWVTGKLRVTGIEGFDETLGCIRSGKNSGYQAIHCAAQAGAKQIALVGFDMHGKHWFGGHRDGIRSDIASICLPYFETLKLDELGIDVVNCSQNSLLNCFRKATLESVIGTEI